MKKTTIFLLLIALFAYSAFSQTAEAEEIDYLLFQPNSSSAFVEENKAMLQLDNLAKYLNGKNLNSGQIIIIGYAAAAMNDIDPVSFSGERALFVINELKKRGVASALFSDPVAYGEVNYWGSNENESEKSPNRRVRIMLGDTVLTPAIVQAENAEKESADAVPEENDITVISTCKFNWKFNWKLLLAILISLLIIALILLLAVRSMLKSKKPVKEPLISTVSMKNIIINLDEEIRMRAYELFQERHGYGGSPDNDWYKARREVCARYEAEGYQTYLDNGLWHACIVIES